MFQRAGCDLVDIILEYPNSAVLEIHIFYPPLANRSHSSGFSSSPSHRHWSQKHKSGNIQMMSSLPAGPPPPHYLIFFRCCPRSQTLSAAVTDVKFHPTYIIFSFLTSSPARMCFCHLCRMICRVFSEMTFVGDLAECMLQILSLQKLRKMA